MKNVIPYAMAMFASLAAAAEPASPVASGEDAGMHSVLRRYVDRFNADDRETHTNAVPNAQAYGFLKDNIPLFECPDKEIERAYYFRWWTFRRHLKATMSGYVITEFLPDVEWAGKYNTINCAAGHHVMEGRWLRDRRYVSDYLRFWFSEGTMSGTRSYVCWPAFAALSFARVSGDSAFAASLLDALAKNWDDWAAGWKCKVYVDRRRDPDRRAKLFPMGRKVNGLFAATDDREGCENSLSGDGFRPLVNAAMWGEANAIAEIARAAGRTGVADDFAARASRLERDIKNGLWNRSAGFFTTLSLDGEHRNVRELAGYAPWYFGMPLAGYGRAWSRLMSTKGFFAPCGLTNPEQTTPGFTIGYDSGRSACRRDGPSWPYDTSLVLSALANALRSDGDLPVGPADYLVLLHQYAAAHRLHRPDGRTVSWIDEDWDPFTGEWMARAIFRIQKKKSCYDRGRDYNHSSFCDLVISGLCGVCPQTDDRLVIRPLASPHWRYFRLSNLFYHGRRVTVSWDLTGERYGLGRGLSVWVDGTERFRSCRLEEGCEIDL